MASSRHFFSYLREEFCNTDEFKVAAYSYRQDATNSKDKVTCMEMDVAYLVGFDGKQDITDFDMGWFARLKRVSDVVRVENSTGHGTAAMALKSMGSLGCDAIQEDIRNLDWSCCLYNKRNTKTMAQSLHTVLLPES